MPGIAIDLVGAEAVLGDLRLEVDNSLRPVVDMGMRNIAGEAPFGQGSPSGEVTAARTAYRDVAQVQMNNLAVHLSNAENLIDGLKLAIEGYRRSDRESASSTPVEFEDETVASDAIGVGVVAGYAATLPPPTMPERGEYHSPHCTDWGSYNVPRDAMILQGEGGHAFEPIMNLRRFGEGLHDYYRRLVVLRQDLARVWSPQVSEAAEKYQQLLDRHIQAVAQDCLSALSNANAFYGIVDALVQAKGSIDDIHARWNEVTSDWTPEFWDHAAEELNMRATAQLNETDNAVRDWRSRVVVPESTSPFPGTGEPRQPPPPPPPETRSGAGGAAGGGAPAGAPVPPVPGMNPVTGPALAGAPQPVPASASNPPSMLPIPPGVSPLAPNGGAWVLPGPGVGPLGRLLPMPHGPASHRPGFQGPMPQRPGFGGPGGVAGARPPVAGSAGFGGVGSPSAGGGQAGMVAGGGRGGAGKAGRGKVAPGAGREKWSVRRGVPPVIDSSKPDQPDDDDFGFDSWFARTATPWKGLSEGAR